MFLSATDNSTPLLSDELDLLTAKAVSIRYADQTEEPGGWYYGRIRLAWTRREQSSVDGYRVFRSADKLQFEQIAEVTANSYVDADLSTGTKYYYRVRPFTHLAGSQASLGTASAVTHLPPTQANITCETDGVVSLRAMNDSDDVDEFHVEWRVPGAASNQSSTIVAEYEGGAGLTAFAETQIDGLEPDSAYVFRVTAINAVKHAEPIVHTIVPIGSPDVVETQNLEDGTLRVLWRNNSALASMFKVEWTRDEDRWVHVKVAGGADRSAILKRLVPNTSYSIRITALAGDLESEASWPYLVERT